MKKQFFAHEAELEGLDVNGIKFIILRKEGWDTFYIRIRQDKRNLAKVKRLETS